MTSLNINTLSVIALGIVIDFLDLPIHPYAVVLPPYPWHLSFPLGVWAAKCTTPKENIIDRKEDSTQAIPVVPGDPFPYGPRTQLCTSQCLEGRLAAQSSEFARKGGKVFISDWWGRHFESRPDSSIHPIKNLAHCTCNIRPYLLATFSRWFSPRFCQLAHWIVSQKTRVQPIKCKFIEINAKLVANKCSINVCLFKQSSKSVLNDV